MILDVNSLLSQNQAITATAVSSGVYDVAGLGVGVTVNNIVGVGGTGAAAVFGNDIGAGGPNASAPQILCQIGTTFTSGGSSTLQVQLQCAIDDGTGNPSTWDTIAQTDTIAKALLTAGTKLAPFTVPDRYPGQGFPRFYRLNYVVATGPFTAGNVTAAIVTGLDDQTASPANY